MDENSCSTLKLVDYKSMFCKPELDINTLGFIAPELITII
jgi:hypothetical protein